MNAGREKNQPSIGLETIYTPAIAVTDELLDVVNAAPRGSAETYGATPFDKIKALIHQQGVLEGIQRILREVPDGVPLIIAAAVQEAFNKRFWQRLDANDEKFLSSATQLLQQTLDSRLDDIIDKGRIGNASPAELLLAHDQLGASSLELACVTHPYGEKIENLDPMHEAIEYAVVGLGGEYEPNPEPTYALKELITDFDGTIIGVLMTRKRDFGNMPNGTIVRERSSFIVRVDSESELVKMLGQADVHRFAELVRQSKKDQQDSLKEFAPIIAPFLEYDMFLQAIPVASTVYAFNKRAAELNEQLEPLAAQRQREYELHMPADEVVESELQQRTQSIIDSYASSLFQSYNTAPAYLSEENESPQKSQRFIKSLRRFFAR